MMQGTMVIANIFLEFKANANVLRHYWLWREKTLGFGVTVSTRF